MPLRVGLQAPSTLHVLPTPLFLSFFLLFLLLDFFCALYEKTEFHYVVTSRLFYTGVQCPVPTFTLPAIALELSIPADTVGGKKNRKERGNLNC